MIHVVHLPTRRSTFPITSYSRIYKEMAIFRRRTPKIPQPHVQLDGNEDPGSVDLDSHRQPAYYWNPRSIPRGSA
jgi:hypothetical protein